MVNVRLDKRLADAGWGSRKEIRKLIGDGRVTVDGQVQTDPASHVESAQAVSIDEKNTVSSGFHYYMLYKPCGVVTATRDPNLPTVMQLLPRQLQAQKLFPVGRLDRDTEGLLFLTDDGPWGHRVTAPTHEVPKVYEALVKGDVTDADVRAFADGLILRTGRRFAPARLSVLSAGEEPLIEVVLTEGKYHQVKRMLAARSHPVLSLKRTAIGVVKLDPELAPGQTRALTEDEIRSFNQRHVLGRNGIGEKQ